MPPPLRNSSASLACCAIVLAIHMMGVAAGDGTVPDSWYESFGLSRAGFLAGKPWQLASYGLLHGSWWHLGLNLLFVLTIGPRIEAIVGSRAMVRALLAGVLAGGLCHLLLGSGLLVGLSGGCLALLLLLTTLSPQSRMLPLPVSGKSLGLGVMTAELLLALADPSLGVPGIPAVGNWLAAHGIGTSVHVGHACHFGGGVAGWLYGRWLLRSRVTLAQLQRDRARREAQ